MKFSARNNFGLLASAIALALAGCGGGGGGGGGSSPATVGGNAVKGIIKNGIVVAEELNADKSVKAQVGSATTDADGSYSLKLSNSYADGPIQITISADADTEMKCDIPAGCGTRNDSIVDTNNPSTVDFGEWYMPGAGNLSMTALLGEAAANSTISVNVTPYTDLAARRAKQNTTLDASAVDIANSEVNQLLGGIDILRTKPLDITDSTAISNGTGAQKAYAAYAAAIGVLADATSGNPDISGALDTLETSFSDGTILADDTGAESGKYSLQEIINGAQSTFTKAGTTDTSGTLTALQNDVNSAGAGGSVDPEASSTAGLTGLDKVKAFVADVRTWGTVIEQETTAQANAFDGQATLASEAADMSGQLVMSPALEAAVEAIVSFYDGSLTETDLSLSGLGFDSGTIGSSGSTITITNGVIGGATVNMTAELPVDNTTATSFTLGITSATITSDAMDADINGGTITLTTSSSYTLDLAGIDAGTAPEPDISGGSLDFDVAITQKQDTMGNPLSADVTFAGALEVSLVNPQQDSQGNLTWITPKTLSMTGGVSTTDGNSLEFTLSADVTNANSFTPVGGLDVGHIKSNIVTWSYSGNTFTAKSPEVTETMTWDYSSGSVNITQTWSDGSSYSSGYFGNYPSLVSAVQNNITYSSIYYDIYYGGTIWVDGEGDYIVLATGNEDITTNGSLNGELVDPDFVIESSSHWLDANASLSFNLQLAGLPEAYVTIEADRTAYEKGKGTITMVYGTRQIVISGTASNTSTTGSMTITNQDGVTMEISGDAENGTGQIKFNGTKFADITTDNAGTKLTYTNGDFEYL